MFIYCATSPSGKQYIGQTRRDVGARWKEHLADARGIDRCKALNCAIRKYGHEAFVIEIVAYALPWLLDELEAMMIQESNTAVPAGYNIKLGGSTAQHSKETIAKIRAKLVGKTFRTETLMLRGRSKKREKSLPMFVCGWYKCGALHGVRCTNPSQREKRFSLRRYGTLEACTQAALDYMTDGMQFNDSMAVGRRESA